MASSSAKKAIARNKVILRNVVACEIAALALSALLGAAQPKRRLAIFAKAVPELLGIFVLFRISRPQTKNGELVSGGTLLDKRGVASLCFDFVYVSWAVRALSLFSAWAYLLYGVLGISLCYEFVPRVLGVFRA